MEEERRVGNFIPGSVHGVPYCLRRKRWRGTCGLGWRVRKWHGYLLTQIVFSCRDPICSFPIPLPRDIGNLGASSLSPTIMPQFPCAQLLATFSKPLLLFFFINKALVLFRMAMLPAETLTPTTSLGALVVRSHKSWPVRLEMEVLGSDSQRSLQKWTDLVDFLFAFWPFSCLLA